MADNPGILERLVTKVCIVLAPYDGVDGSLRNIE